MRRTGLTLALVALVTAAGCVSGTITALNPLTGERRDFDTEESVPDGWIVCAEADGCPPPRACDALDEAACLTRADCSPVYVGIGAYPRECDGEDPPPGICDGEGFAGCTEAAPTCDAAACGPAPLGATYLCADGSVGGVTGRCVMGAAGACGWEIRACPDPAPDECAPAECGPAPLLPAIACADGSEAGSTGRCLRGDDGACGWEIRECPPSDCAPEECGPEPVAPEYVCWDGSLGGHTGTCDRGADGVCGWTARECPPEPPAECGDEECGPAPAAPLYECWDGSLGGNVGRCERDADGFCGWVFRECPPEPCVEDECGPPPASPAIACADGSTAGNTGRCLREADGTCGWEIRECPDACAATPACDLECPEGSHHPVDPDGCVRTCECVEG